MPARDSPYFSPSTTGAAGPTVTADTLLENSRERRLLVEARGRIVCGEAFPTEVDAARHQYRYHPERCSRVRSPRGRRGGPSTATMASARVRRREEMLEADRREAVLIRRHLASVRGIGVVDAADVDLVADALNPTPISRAAWVWLLDAKTRTDARNAHRGMVWAMGSRCVISCFRDMIDPVQRRLIADPVMRATHLVNVWNDGLLGTLRPASLRRQLQRSMTIELTALMLTHIAQN